MKLRLALALPVVLAGCDGTETGNPFTAEARLHAHSSEPGRIAVADAAQEARIDAVWIGAGPITLVGENCTDALAMTPTPEGANHAVLVSTLEFELRPQPICALRVPIAPVASVPPGAPPELAGHSVLVSGVRISDGVPLQIRTTLTRDLVLAATDGTFVFEADDPGMFLGFDVARWLPPAFDLAGAPITGGRIVIEAGVDDARLATFEAGFPPGLELYTDHDRNGSATGEDVLARGTP